MCKGKWEFTNLSFYLPWKITDHEKLSSIMLVLPVAKLDFSSSISSDLFALLIIYAFFKLLRPAENSPSLRKT